MYNTTTVNTCLKPTITLSDAYPYAPTFLTDDIIAQAIPTNSTQSTVLDALLTGSVTKMMGDVIRIKKITNAVRSNLDDFWLFEGKADLDQKVVRHGRFVFLAHNLRTNNDIGLNIYRLSFHADMACPDMKFYLYNSELNAPVSVTPMVYDTPRSVKWIDVALPITSDNGVWYLGYYEDDMAPGAQAFQKTLQYVNQPTCTTCNQSYYNQYQKRSKYVNIQPGYCDAGYINEDRTLFDTDKINWIDFNNFGINIRVTVSCDISEFVCRTKSVFYDALSMRYALDIINYLLMNTRNNAVLEQIKDGIIFLRDGDKTNGTVGFSVKYEEAIEALNIDLSGFNELCLPCTKNAMVKRAYIG